MQVEIEHRVMTWRKQNELESIPCIPTLHGFFVKECEPARSYNDYNLDLVVDSSSSDLVNGIGNKRVKRPR